MPYTSICTDIRQRLTNFVFQVALLNLNICPFLLVRVLSMHALHMPPFSMLSMSLRQ